MRIVAGSAKGTRLATVPPGVRPLSDRAREGLFASLGDRVVGARVLDLYAGTGALGIEALSRGAEAAVFVERARTAVRAIHENLERARLAGRGTVVAAEVLAFLRRPRRPGAPFDLVLADPPYDLPVEELEAVLAELARGWLAPGFTVVLTRRKGSSTPVVPLHWAPARRLAYGDTLVVLMREA